MFVIWNSDMINSFFSVTYPPLHNIDQKIFFFLFFPKMRGGNNKFEDIAIETI